MGVLNQGVMSGGVTSANPEMYVVCKMNLLTHPATLIFETLTF